MLRNAIIPNPERWWQLYRLQMDNPKQFNIKIKQNFPFLSKGLFWTMAILLGILFIGYLIMTPAKNASDEIATAYYILVVPNFLKTLFGYAALGLLITVPLYYFTKLTHSAVLTIDNSCLHIKGKNFGIEIPFKKIRKIYFNDLKDLLRRPKYKTEIVINQKNRKHTVFTLTNYDDSEIVLVELAKIPNVDFSFYDTSMQVTHDEE